MSRKSLRKVGSPPEIEKLVSLLMSEWDRNWSISSGLKRGLGSRFQTKHCRHLALQLSMTMVLICFRPHSLDFRAILCSRLMNISIQTNHIKLWLPHWVGGTRSRRIPFTWWMRCLNRLCACHLRLASANAFSNCLGERFSARNTAVAFPSYLLQSVEMMRPRASRFL